VRRLPVRLAGRRRHVHSCMIPQVLTDGVSNAALSVTSVMADDRFAHGYDAGNIVDGIVERDSVTGEYILVDEDGERFNPQRALAMLLGKKVRMTMVSFDALEEMGKMYEAARAAMGKPD